MDNNLSSQSGFKTVLSLLIAVLGIYYVVSNIPLLDTWNAVQRSDILLVSASFVALGVIYFVMSERWRFVLSEKNVEVSSRKSFVQIVASDFVNTFAPMRAGDIYRGMMASNNNKNTLETSIIVLMERVMDVAAISILLIIALISFLPRQEILVYPVTMLGIILAGLIGYLLLLKLEEFPADKLNNLYKKFRDAAVDNFGTDRLVELLAITLLIWVLGVVRTLFIFEALDISMGLGAVAVITFSWAIVAALPLSPSGIGATDAVIFYLLNQFVVEPSMAAAFIVLNRIILQGFPLVIGGALYFKRQK